MKLYRSIKKCNYCLVAGVIGLLCSFNLLAKPVALVSAVSGDVFYSFQGSTKPLQLGMHIPNGADVFGELGAQLTMTDYYDHRYHLSSGGHIKVLDNNITLLSGYLWVQSFQTEHEAQVVTANSTIEYIKGDAIISFDNMVGKTQLLVVSGDFSLANLINPELKTDVLDGQFSFITSESETPRNPTTCGFQSFKKVITLFDGVQPMEKGSLARLNNVESKKVQATRKIASVVAPTEGTITLRIHGKAANRMPASVIDVEEDKYVAEFYKDQLKKLAASPTTPKKEGRSIANKKSAVKVRIFGSGGVQESKTPEKMPEWKVKKVVNARVPASVTPMAAKSEFERSMSKQLMLQKRHPTEVNRLIDELNSYDQDFVKAY